MRALEFSVWSILTLLTDFCRYLVKKDLDVSFDRTCVRIAKTIALKTSRSKYGFLFCLNTVDEKVHIAGLSQEVSLDNWHCRLGHAFHKRI